MIDNKHYVYVLKDPRNNNAVFYVGKGTTTKTGKFYRINQHIGESLRWVKKSNHHKCGIIKKIIESNLNVGFEIISQHPTDDEALLAEKQYAIRIGLEKLTNIAKRLGQKTLTIARNDACRKKIGLKNKIKMMDFWADPENRKKRISQLTGRKMSIATCLESSQRLKIFWSDPVNHKNRVASMQQSGKP